MSGPAASLSAEEYIASLGYYYDYISFEQRILTIVMVSGIFFGGYKCKSVRFKHLDFGQSCWRNLLSTYSSAFSAVLYVFCKDIVIAFNY